MRAPAKVNLHLGVGPRRTDGYHDLKTVFLALSLHDELTAAPAPDLSVEVTGEGAANVPLDESNLAVRAARALATAAKVPPRARLTIHKGIPVAGGMAGGSADAAAALVACNALWGTGLAPGDLARIGAGLGSDVPFALHGGTALGVGRGERLTEVLARGRTDWVLALAEDGLSTPNVYAELDRLRASGPPRVVRDADDVLAALRSGDPARLGPVLGNDLEPAAVRLRPSLVRVLAAGREAGALGGLVSGSGPTCAFLARSVEHALTVAARLSADGVCRSVRTAHGPVPGARVVP